MNPIRTAADEARVRGGGLEPAPARLARGHRPPRRRTHPRHDSAPRRRRHCPTASPPLAAATARRRRRWTASSPASSVALAEGRKPDALDDLPRRIEAAVTRREAFCRAVAERLPPAPAGTRKRAERRARSRQAGQGTGRRGAGDLGPHRGARQAPPRHHPRATRGGRAGPTSPTCRRRAEAGRVGEAEEAPPPGFHDRPVLVVDPGRHTATINRADADAAGRLAATASRRQDRAALVAGGRGAAAHHPPARRARECRQGLRGRP